MGTLRIHADNEKKSRLGTALHCTELCSTAMRSTHHVLRSEQSQRPQRSSEKQPPNPTQQNSHRQDNRAETRPQIRKMRCTTVPTDYSPAAPCSSSRCRVRAVPMRTQQSPTAAGPKAHWHVERTAVGIDIAPTHLFPRAESRLQHPLHLNAQAIDTRSLYERDSGPCACFSIIFLCAVIALSILTLRLIRSRVCRVCES